MIILGIFGLIALIGSLCWLLFTLAVYALPFFVGLQAGLAAYHSGAGVLGAILVGLAAGGVTLLVGQILFATVPSLPIRAAVGLLFAAPAAAAGYHAVLGLARHVVPSEAWQQVFAVTGSVAIAATAWCRMALTGPPPAQPATPRRTEPRQASPPLPRLASANDR